MNRAAVAALAIVLAAGTASAERLRTIYVPTTLPPGTSTAVSSNVIFLDRCTGGCSISGPGGGDDSRYDRSSIAGGHLSEFSCGDAVWSQVMQCVKGTFRDFNVVITDVDPGTTGHMEIKVAGLATEVGMSGNIGGVAPFTCNSYLQNALVFDFANGWGCSVTEICATAAQEIAHTWAMDHVVDASDPMTYFTFSGQRYYHDSVQCGSDCVDSSGRLCKVGDSGCRSPYGNSCTTAQTHVCACDQGTSTQNDHAMILALFGQGTPTVPVVTFKKPLDGSAVSPGFAVQVDVASDYPFQKAELRVDGKLVQSVGSAPYVFNAPDTLMPGPHTVEVTGIDIYGGAGKKSITAIIGDPCTKAADCPNATDTCIGGRCVAGSSVPGGIGSPCNAPQDCLEGLCASDGTNKYCTTACNVGDCPMGLGCLPDGSSGTGETGVCWPGYNDGSGGGGGCATSNGAPLTLGLALLGLAASRRRRR